MPQTLVRYHLEDFQDPSPQALTTRSPPLEARKAVKVCQFINGLSSCVTIARWGKDAVTVIANHIKNLADKKSCGTFTGFAGPNSEITYRYQANGRHCDTTAEENTIAGAINHHLKNKNNNRLCYTECLDLTHGGTWDGYLLIGPTHGFKHDAYCGPALNFGNCDSGGKYDL